VSLSLINVKAVSTMSGIRAFDLNQELADAQKGPSGLFDLMATRKEPPPPPELAAPATITPVPTTKPKSGTSTKPKKPGR